MIRVCECRQLKVPMRLTSESPFTWDYNETLPTRPNLSEWLFLTSECLFLTSECRLLTSECLFLTSERLFLTSESLFLTSENPFNWVYNQTLPTKPNLPESLFPTSECLSQPEGKGPLREPLMSIFLKSLRTFNVYTEKIFWVELTFALSLTRYLSHLGSNICKTQDQSHSDTTPLFTRGHGENFQGEKPSI